MEKRGKKSQWAHKQLEGCLFLETVMIEVALESHEHMQCQQLWLSQQEEVRRMHRKDRARWLFLQFLL